MDQCIAAMEGFFFPLPSGFLARSEPWFWWLGACGGLGSAVIDSRRTPNERRTRNHSDQQWPAVVDRGEYSVLQGTWMQGIRV